MITVIHRKLTIPDEERFIGFLGDHLSNTKTFFIEDGDLSHVFTLCLGFDDGSSICCVPTKQQMQGGVMLSWQIEKDDILKSGLVKARIRITDTQSQTVAYTTSDYFFASPSDENEGSSEEERISSYEKMLEKALETIADTMPYIGEDGYWYVFNFSNQAFEKTDVKADPDEDLNPNLFVPITRRICDVALSNDVSIQTLGHKINPAVSNELPDYKGQFGYRAADSAPLFAKGVGTWEKLVLSDELASFPRVHFYSSQDFTAPSAVPVSGNEWAADFKAGDILYTHSGSDYSDGRMFVCTSVSQIANEYRFTWQRQPVKTASYTLAAANWSNGAQGITPSGDIWGYTVTANTKCDIQIDSTVYDQLVSDGCGGIYIENTNGTLTAHALGDAPSVDITVQLTFTEVTVLI